MQARPFGLLGEIDDEESLGRYLQPGGGGVSATAQAPAGYDALGRFAYGMTGAGGVQDAAGLLGGPSLSENLAAGNKFDALMQAIGAAPVVGMLGKAGLGAAALYKAAKATGPEIKAALDPSIARVFYGVDPAKDAQAAKALDMHSQGKTHDQIWGETQRMVGPNGDTVAAETNDHGVGLNADAIDRLKSIGIASGPASELFNPAEIFDAVPRTKDVEVALRYDPRFNSKSQYDWGRYGQGGFAQPSKNKIDVQSDKYAPLGQYDPYDGDLTRMAFHEFGHIAQDETGLTGGPKGGKDFFVRPAPFTMGLLAPYIREYKQAGLLSPIPSDLASDMRQHIDPFHNYPTSDAVQEIADAMPENELNMYLKAYGAQKGGYHNPSFNPFDAYYRTYGEGLSRLGEMRLGLQKEGRRLISPKQSFSVTGRNQPAFSSLYEMPRSLVY